MDSKLCPSEVKAVAKLTTEAIREAKVGKFYQLRIHKASKS